MLFNWVEYNWIYIREMSRIELNKIKNCLNFSNNIINHGILINN